MDDKQDVAGLVEREPDDAWVIVKRDLFYRPDWQGYTGIRDHAGRYTEAEAKAAAEMDGVSCMRLADAPEYTNACFHDLKFDHMQAKLTTALEAQAAEIARLKEAVELFRSFGCPQCNGDCGSANPPVQSCPMQIAAALTGSQSHDAVAERLKAGTEAAASQVLAAEVDLLMNGDPAAKPKPWGSQSHD